MGERSSRPYRRGGRVPAVLVQLFDAISRRSAGMGVRAVAPAERSQGRALLATDLLGEDAPGRPGPRPPAESPSQSALSPALTAAEEDDAHPGR